MNNISFLHFGPGGNAFAERALLAAELPTVDFWDQPAVKSEPDPFQNLVSACAEKIKNDQPDAIIAHSFGCDLLIAALNQQNFNSGPLVLVSPIISIPAGVYNMGQVLFNQKPEPGLKAALDAAKESLPDLSVEHFWGLISQIVIHPGYALVFWKSPAELAIYQKVVSEGPSFDAAEWQTVIQDYLFKNSRINFDILKSKKVTAIFGDGDPYLNLEKDLIFWQELLGPENVVVIKDSGHYPHLENKRLFLKSLTSIKLI